LCDEGGKPGKKQPNGRLKPITMTKTITRKAELDEQRKNKHTQDHALELLEDEK